MKRTLLSVTAVLAALMLFFAGCQDPLSDFTVTNKDELPEIAGPEWVKAEPFAGANHITWAFTKDAKGFVIYRQEVNADGEELSDLTELSEIEQGNPQYKNREYIDAVTLQNPLENGKLYRYAVVAYSSGSISGRAVVSVKDGLTYMEEPVTANIPARGTVVTELVTPKLTDTDIKFEAVKKIDGHDELEVSWPSAHPAFNYSVKYVLGGTTLAVDIPNASGSVVGDTTKYYHTPLFGGTTQISLGVIFSNDEYFYKPATISKAVTGLSLSQPLSLLIYNYSVTRQNSGSEATIVWDSDSSVPNAGHYKLYRIEAKNIGTEEASYNFPPIEVVGDWTLVTGIDSATNGTITVTDTGLDPVKGYLYALYAEVDGRKSAPRLHGLGPAQVSIDQLAFDVETFYETADDTRTYKVTIGWNAADGATGYKLEKAITTQYPTETIAAYTAVGTAAAPAQVGGRYTVTDTPAIRQSYKYRLTATVNGVEVVAFKDLDTDPFREYVAGSFSVNSSNDTAYATDISFGPSSYIKDITADIYRAEVPKNINTSVTTGWANWDAIEQAAFTKIKADYSVDDSNYTDIGLTIGTRYIYRVEYKADGKVLYDNSSYKDYTGFVQEPSVPQVYYKFSRTYQGTRNYYALSYGTSLIGARIVWQTKANNASTWTTSTNAGTVERYSSDATATLKWGTGSTAIDTGVSPGSYYFFVTPQTNPGTTQYRLVLVNSENADYYSDLDIYF